ISQRMGFTIARRGPIQRASSRSVTRSSVRDRLSSSSSTRGPTRARTRVAWLAARGCFLRPAPRGSRMGNRLPALRWHALLRRVGHTSFIAGELGAKGYDVLVALHARKAALAVQRSRARHPERPVVVALTGTDLYRDIHHDASAQRSLELADRLIV